MHGAAAQPRRRRVIAACVIAAVGIAAFFYRFNTFGGALGGFDDDHFIGLARANQLLAGEWPLRDYPDASLQGAWPPLAYLPSAAAQLLFGRTLLAEGLLVAGAIGVSAALTALVVWRLGLALPLAVLAAALSVMPSVKPYGWARPVLFAAGALMIWRYGDKPSGSRLAALGALFAVAFVVRHDYAVYFAPGLALAIAASHWKTPALAVRRVVTWGALAALLILPSLLLVEVMVGLRHYLSDIQALTLDERIRTYLQWPAFDRSSLASETNAIAWLYYVFLVLPLAAAAVALWRAGRGAAPAELPTVLGVAATAAVANHYLLRGNLGARLADPAVLHAILGTWLFAVAVRPPWRRVAVRAPAALAAVMILSLSAAALAAVGSAVRELQTARFTEGPIAAAKTTLRVAGELRGQPPDEWHQPYPMDGAMLAAAYLHECTSPDDRVLNARYGAEALVFGRRLFAAGQVNFVPGHYASRREQQQAVARAERQSIPIAFMEPVEAFARDFTLVDAFLRAHYDEVGSIPAGDSVFVRVFARRDRMPVRTFADTGLPCFR